MNIVCQVSVKCITSKLASEGSMAPAWVEVPDFFPLYNSPAQRNMKIKMYIYKQEMDSYYKLVMIISHELAHLFLYSLNHSLRRNEDATDICAIVMGFGRFYELGQTTYNGNVRTKLGYLSFEEICYVLSIVEGQRVAITPPTSSSKSEAGKKTSWFSKLFGNL
jgi:hypothetical protein